MEVRKGAAIVPGGTGPNPKPRQFSVGLCQLHAPIGEFRRTAIAAALSAIDEGRCGGLSASDDPEAGTSSLVEIEWIGLDHALGGSGPEDARREHDEH